MNSPLDSIDRLLVVALGTMEEVVASTALLKPLKRWAPQARVGFLAPSFMEGFLRDHSMIDDLHTTDRFCDDRKTLGRFSVPFKTDVVLDMAFGHYPLALLLNGPLRARWLVKRAHVPVRVGMAHPWLSWGLEVTLLPPPRPLGLVQSYRRFLELWSGQSISDRECRPRLEKTEDNRAWWNLWLGRMHWEKKTCVVLDPFSHQAPTAWSLKNWVLYMRALRAADSSLRFPLVVSAFNSNRLKNLALHFPSDCFAVVAGAPAENVKAIVGNSRLVVGGEQGAVAVARALGCSALDVSRFATVEEAAAATLQALNPAAPSLIHA